MVQPDTLINGRYRILHTLGIGGMGTVYAAHDQRLGREVALKLLRADLATDVRARDRFLREAQIAAQLIHPNIVRTYDVGDAPEGPYLVQELLDGQTLDRILPLPPHVTIAVATGIAEALSYIHEQGYVHCDIKPQNIMLLGDPADPRPVLLDFGIARVEGAVTTTLIATPQYLAPERVDGSPPTAASDLYALGIVLYQTLTGRPPFDAPSLHAILEQHRNAPLPPLNVHAPEAATLESVIRKLAAKRPEGRYPSAAALRNDLNRIEQGPIHAQPTVAMAAPPQPDTAINQAPPQLPPVSSGKTGTKVPPRARVNLIWLLGVPLIVGALLIGAALTRDHNPSPSSTAPNLTTTQAPPAASPAPVNVPAVIGLSIEEAQRQIEGAGLKFTLGDAVESEQPAGSVVSTDPAPDQPLAPGSTVVVQPSAGPPPAAAPPQNQDDNAGQNGDQKPGKGNDKGKGKGKGKKD